MRHKPSNLFTILFCALALAGTATTRAGTISLAWDPAPSAAGYTVHYGPSPGTYSQTVDVGLATTATLQGLDDCSTYHVAVRAYNGAGPSVAYSNEVVGWARPTISSIDPGEVEQGSQQTLEIVGSNFDASANLDYEIVGSALENPEALVRIENTSVLSCTRIQALLTVEPTAGEGRAMQVGEFQLGVDVVNPDRVYGNGSDAFDVLFREDRADLNDSDASTEDRVDGKDLIWLAHAYGSQDGEGAYSPNADLNGDGIIDGEDLVYLAVRFGRCWDGQSWAIRNCP